MPTPKLNLHVRLCFGRMESVTLAKKTVEIESPVLLMVKCQSAGGRSASNRRERAAISTWSFLAITGPCMPRPSCLLVLVLPAPLTYKVLTSTKPSVSSDYHWYLDWPWWQGYMSGKYSARDSVLHTWGLYIRNLSQDCCVYFCNLFSFMWPLDPCLELDSISKCTSVPNIYVDWLSQCLTSH